MMAPAPRAPSDTESRKLRIEPCAARARARKNRFTELRLKATSPRNQLKRTSSVAAAPTASPRNDRFASCGAAACFEGISGTEASLGARATHSRGNKMSKPPLTMKLSEEKSVSLTAIACVPPCVNCADSAAFKGAEPLSPPCQTASPVYAAAPRTGTSIGLPSSAALWAISRTTNAATTAPRPH